MSTKKILITLQLKYIYNHQNRRVQQVVILKVFPKQSSYVNHVDTSNVHCCICWYALYTHNNYNCKFRHLPKVNTDRVSNPLVALLCIGKYDGMPSLIESTTYDYRNMIHTFHDVLGYKIIYKHGKNNNIHFLKQINKANIQNNNDKNNYKCQCKKKEIIKMNG